jgi:lipoprotein signal peptidase
MKARNIVIWTFIAVLIDQAIKIFINAGYYNAQVEIIPSLVEFKPTFNTHHSWVNSLLNSNLGINVGQIPHILLYIMLGILIPMYFTYFRNRMPKGKKLIDVAIVFLMSAIVCALSGNIIWREGTLDYIYLIPLFVFDLKDVYIDLGMALFILYTIRNRKEFEHIIKGMKFSDVYTETINRFKTTQAGSSKANYTDEFK